MTTALYRRYRPDTFQDVIGQEHVTAPLMAALRADKVTHAYLFSGPRGCGKTTSARILARCLNCEKFPTDTPCGQCPSCQDLATGGPGSLDVVEIDAASHNGVDDARDLRERASFAPARDRFKIFILDEAHMVTPQGFNALLKLVEEPPAHVKFIFATTEPEKVIGTIRSRTHHYPFRLVPPDVLEGYLAHLCQAEGVEVGPGVFPLVTRAGGGSVRDTLSVMDQLIGGAIDGEVDYQRAVALLGYTDTTMLDQCIDAIAAADGAGVFRVVDRVVTSGHDPRRFVEDLLQRLRDLLVIALAGTEAGPALGSLPQDELGRMEVQSRTIGAAGLSRAADMTAQALSQMVGATSPRLQLELLMARLLVPSQRPAGAAGAAPVAAPATQAPTAAPTGGGAVATGGVPVGGAPAGGAPRSASEAPAGRGGRARAAEIARRAGAQGVEAAAPGTGDQGAPQDAAVLAGDENEHVSVDWDAPAPVGDGSAPADTAATASPAASRPPTTRSAGTVPPAQGSARAEAGSGASPSEGSAADAEMIRTRWEEVLDAAKRSRRATWALVGPNSQPGSIHGGVFQVLFTGRGLVGAFENGGHGPILAAAIHQALGLELEVHAVLAGGDGDGPGGGGPAGGGSGPRGGGPGNAARAVSASSGRGAPASRGRGRSSDAGASGQRGVPAWDEAPAWDSPQDAGTGTPSATTSSATRPNEDASDAAAPGEAADADDHQTGTTSPGSAPGARGSARSAPAVDDDGWGEAAVPGGGRITEEAAPLSQPTVDAPTAVRGNRLGGGAASPSQRRADAAPATTSHPANESAAARPSEADAAADGGDGDDESMTPAEEAAAGARASEEDPEAQQTEDPALAAAHAAAQRSDEQDEETDEDDDIADLAGDGSRPDASDPGSGEPDIGPSDDRPSQPGHAGSGPLDLERAGSGPSDPGSADPGSSAGAALGSSSAQPSADNASSGRVPPEDDAGRDPDEPRLATVHRLRALPEIPGGASSSGTPTGGAGTESADEPSDDPSRGTTSAAPGSVGEPSGRPAPGGPVGGSSAGRPDRRGLAPVSWDGPASETSSPAPWDAGPQTFSDGIPLPDEPGDPDGPEDGWSPPGQSGRRVSAAMAAARAAARGDAPAAGRGHGGAVRGRPGPGSDDDAVSEDDEDAEEAGVVGLEVVKRLLGATVLEDITINHEGS